MEPSGSRSDIEENDPLLSTRSFPFESESIAMKGNTDYTKLLQHLNMLESLRMQSIRDMERLADLQAEYLGNPQEFLRKIKCNEDLGLPQRLTTPDMPEIDWSKYKAAAVFDDLRPITRKKPVPREPLKASAGQSEFQVYGTTKSSDRSRSAQLWTVEEQLKLEQLLLKYPLEDNEARRFAKIAEELGTRTLSQVTSRCQKYFLKLQKLKLPIPGRVPKQRHSDNYRVPKPKTATAAQFHVSTFFPRSHPPVRIKDDGDLPGTSSIDTVNIKVEPGEGSDSADAPDASRYSSEYRKMLLIRRVKRELEDNADQQDYLHAGYKCNLCHEDPLRGTRWHCIQCGDADSIDFCSSCLIAQLDGETPHNLEHIFAACRPKVSANSWDCDYSYQNNQYNYLDPNFVPD